MNEHSELHNKDVVFKGELFVRFELHAVFEKLSQSQTALPVQFQNERQTDHCSQ